MTGALGALAGSFACGLALTPLVRRLAARRGLLDHALTSRKVHGRDVPRLGGVAIAVASVAAVTGALAASEGLRRAADPGLLVTLLLGGLAILAVGVYDDVRGAGARFKFAVEFGVAALAWALGCRIEAVSLPVIGFVDLGLLGLPLTLLWIAGVVNALNLVDGLDGLAGSVSLVVLVAFGGIALARGDGLLLVIVAALAGAILAFLVFNVHPASIFMGDSGSLFIGFALAVLSMEASEAPHGAVALLVPALALGYPIADTALAIVRRAVRGVPLFCADREHIHHRLLGRGFSHGEASLILCGVSQLLCAAALVVGAAPGPWALAALAAVACAAVPALRWLGFRDWFGVPAAREARRRNVARQHRVMEIASHLQHACDPEGIGTVLAELGPVLDAELVALKAAGRSWTFTPAGKDHLHVVRYDLQPRHSGEDVLEVGWTGEAEAPDAYQETAVEQLCPYVSAALRRIDGAATSAGAGCAEVTHLAGGAVEFRDRRH